MESVKNNDEQISMLLLERYWRAYEVIDDKRRKAFFFLYYLIGFLAVMYFYPQQTIKIQTLRIPLFAILCLSPILLSFSAVRYFYLCARSLNSYITYLKYFQDCHDCKLKRLNLKVGSQFIVVGEKDVVILKNISPPSLDEFGDLIAEARKKGKQAGIKKFDIRNAILKVRGRKG